MEVFRIRIVFSNGKHQRDVGFNLGRQLAKEIKYNIKLRINNAKKGNESERDY